MKNSFFSTRKVSVLVIILVFTFGGACSRQDSNVTYFENTIEETEIDEGPEEIIVEEIDENIKVIKAKKEDIELNEKENLETEDAKDIKLIEKDTTEIRKENNNNNETVKENQNTIDNVPSEVEINKESNGKSGDEYINDTRETEDKSEVDDKTAEESILDESIIESAKGDVTMADRAEATALAMKRLSAQELRSLITMSRDGFTAAEKKEALQMMRDKFTAEEQEWILSKFYEYVGGN